MKKILSLLVIFALAASMLVSTAFAAGTAIYVDSVNAKAGEEVTIDVSISGNTGFAAAKVQLVYDSSVLTLKRISTGLLAGGAVNEAKGLVTFSSATDVTGDGVLLSATFAVADSAPDGVASVSVNVSRLANTSSVSLNPSVVAGGVSVKNPHTHSHNKVVTAPTCTEKGYTTYTCVCGDSYKADEVAALGHKWDNGTVTTPATEGKPGVRTYKCTVCGETKTEEIPALDHTHKYTKTVTAPTCNDKGYTTYTCSCGDSYKDDYKDALGHKWDKGTVTAPTCNDKGHITYKCAACGETKKEELPALSHKWDKGTVTAPTCTEKGHTVYKCTACGETKTQETAALGHKWEKGAVTEPTCEEKGSTAYKCSACGETKAEEIAALGHNWDNGTVTTEPTEEAAGVRTYKCSACGETKTEKIPALGHKHQNTTSVTAPTCTEKGYTTYTCTSCGDSYKGDYVDAKGHSYTEPTFTWGEGNATCKAAYGCSVCGEDFTADAVVTTDGKASCATGGKVTYTATMKLGDKTYTATAEGEASAKAHSYITTWTWAEDYSAASVRMVCKGCLNAVEVKSENVTITTETTQPQKGVDGKTVYTASAVVEGETFTDAKTVVIPASEAAGGSAGLYVGIAAVVVVAGVAVVVVLKKKKGSEVQE